MAEEKKNDQVNVDFSKYLELLGDLDKMVAEDMTDRSKFIRKLVSQERARRQQLPLPFIEEKKRSAEREIDSVAV
jgi:hypothetical protein